VIHVLQTEIYLCNLNQYVNIYVSMQAWIKFWSKS